MAVLDLLIVGAGPSGLATAIAARQQGLTCEVVEKGVLVNSIYHFPVNMVFFTTPELLEIGGVPLVSPFDKPTRIEALRYYRRVAEKFDLPLTFGERVLGLSRVPGPGRRASRCWRSAPAGRTASCGAAPAPSSWPWATTITRTGSACRARICRTCRTTTARRTGVTASGS